MTDNDTVHVDPTVDWGAWEGWGVSLAWWANVFGDRDDLADLLFTERTVPLLGHDLPGLGLTIARYNLGASTWQPADGHRMVASRNIPRFKQLEGYWLDGRSDDPDAPSWNWSADPRQRAMLVKARDRGADRLELFANSPIWWMCRNHNPSGGPLGSPNLPRENQLRHARYLATVARHARDHWGIAFTSVEPFNEPSTVGGWHAEGTQEGCVILVDAQEPIIEYLRHELDMRGLDGVEIAASDETHVDIADITWHLMSETVRHQVGRVNVHGYQYAAGRRDRLYHSARTDGKRIWQSEYGGGDENGLDMAHNFLRDMARMHPVAWSYWQAVDETPGWGFLLGDLNAGTLTSVNTKYWVFAQLSRHLRPGIRIVGTDAGHTVAAHDPARRRLVLVTATRHVGLQATYDPVPVRRPTGRCCTAVADHDRRGRRTLRRPPRRHHTVRAHVHRLGATTQRPDLRDRQRADMTGGDMARSANPGRSAHDRALASNGRRHDKPGLVRLRDTVDVRDLRQPGARRNRRTWSSTAATLIDGARDAVDDADDLIGAQVKHWYAASSRV